jgi:hypothetical protein
MPIDPKFSEQFSALTNALASAAPLATRLRRDLAGQSEDALALEAAIERAVKAVRQMRPADDEKGGES